MAYVVVSVREAHRAVRSVVRSDTPGSCHWPESPHGGPLLALTLGTLDGPDETSTVIKKKNALGCDLLQIHIVKPNPHVMVVGSNDLWQRLGHDQISKTCFAHSVT